MGKPFEIEIAAAKKHRLRNGFVALAVFLIVLSILAASYLYISSVKFEVVLQDYPSNIQLNVASGKAMQIAGDRVFLLSGRADVQVKAAGYQTKIIRLSDQARESKVTVELDYAEVEVQLVTTEELSSPIWYLDGVLASSAPEVDMNLKPGEYQIQIFSDHHESVALTLILDPAKNFMQEIDVKRKTVNYRIETKPSGAKVYIDDQYVGTAPVAGMIPSSVVRIQARLPGYGSAVEQLDLSQVDGLLDRSYKLKQAKDEVAISFNPVGGRVFVDGAEKPVSSRLSVKAAGVTNIRYSKKGYASQTVRVDSSNRSISFNLEPVFGRVALRSVPSASVTVAGVPYGETPIEIELQATDQIITFSRDGYSPETRSIEVKEDPPKAIDVRLQAWSDYYLSQSKAKMTNKVGINLIRFFPKSFKMGAPRSQHGQRANELMRSVQFSRAIYISEHEVTERQYGLYASGRPSSRKPVTKVSWSDAALFCNWLSLEEGLQPFYKTQGDAIIGFDADSRGYRLPSEAEWEYAARYASKETPTIFSWGDKYEIAQGAGNVADESAQDIVRTFISDYKDGHKESAPVGSFAKENSGLFDMSGNVSEWVHDVYSIEPPNDETVYIDFLGASRGSQHVVKGSNYMSSSWTEFRASFKESVDGPRADVGFRVARYIN